MASRRVVRRPSIARWARSSRESATPGALALASWATLALGVLAVALGVGQGPEVEGSAGRAAVIGALLVALHVRPRRSVAARGNLETINLDEVLFVPIVTMLAPWHSVAIVATASLVGSAVLRRSWVKTIFNVGQLTIATAVGLSLVAWFGARPSAEPEPGTVLAGMVAALAMTATSALAVRIMVAYATGLPVGPLLRDIVHSLVPWSGAVLLGAIGVLAMVGWPPSAILVVGVVLFVERAYAATFRELAGRRLAEELQLAISSLRSYTDPREVRQRLVAAAGDLLGADLVTIFEGPDHVPSGGLSAPLGPNLHLVVSHRFGPRTWTEEDRATLSTLAGVAGDVLRSASAIVRLRTITDAQTEGVIAVDLAGRVTFANPAARQMMRLAEGEAVTGVELETLMVLREHRRPIDLPALITAQMTTHDDDATLVNHEDGQIEVAYSLTPLLVERIHSGAVLVLRDVTERRALDRALAHRALHDDLTGLPNRSLLLERLEHALDRSRSAGGHSGLLFLDLDRFKLVNDSYGHLAGDRLLVAVARRLRERLPAAHSLARLSGDEFVVLVEDVDRIEDVTDVAEHLLAVLREPHDLDGHLIHLSASIGVVLTHSGQERDEALSAADAAAYAAKAAGRDCYRVSSPGAFQVARTRLDLEARMRRSIRDGDFFVEYQPIVTTAAVDVVGAEALVRWADPGRGTIGPEQFIGLAEETGLIAPLGRWVLATACRTAESWTRNHPELPRLTISVNLSPVQFGQPHLVDDVALALRESGLAPSQLCLEITESVLMIDTLSTLATLDAFRALGILVAIDDFGTGYSALSYLKRFPIDLVKLDRTFIRGLDIDAADTEIVSAVIRLSAALGIRTVAEGVEHESQRLLLAEMGCTFAQGYLIARPMSAADFLSFWLRGGAPMTTSLPSPELGLDAA